MLETEIKKLSAQIEQLNNNFETLFKNSHAPNESQIEETGIDEDQLNLELEQNEAATITKDSLRALCLEKSRANKDNKKRIKSILSKHNAKLVDDLTNDNLAEVNKLIGAL